MSTLGKHWKWSKPLSEERKEAIRQKMIGNKHLLGYVPSEDTKQKISQSLKNRVVSEYSRQRTRETWLGRKHSEEAKRKMSLMAIGRKRPPITEETRKKMSIAQSGARGSNWQGGITPLHCTIRNSARMKEVRKECFERDDYRCYDCGSRNGETGKTIHLEAHHLYPFARYPRLRFMLENLITLCSECHNKTKVGRPQRPSVAEQVSNQ